MEDPTKDSYALKMYTQKKASVDITPAEPQFVAQYVGKTEVFVASGKGCTQTAVQRIWDNCYDEKGMRRVSVLINSGGLVMNDAEGKSTGTAVSIADIAYCCAERGAHDRIFAWISKDQITSKLECHALLCASKQRAQIMALTLHQAFHIAYKDWKLLKRTKPEAYGPQGSQNGHNHPGTSDGRKVKRGSSVSRDSSSLSTDSDTSSDSVLMETIMAQMNIVEEEEISFEDSAIIVPH